mgnify:CR=1 FL=1
MVQAGAPSEVGMRPPPALDDVVMRALERDPDTRYQSAADMIEALTRAALRSGLFGSKFGVGTWVRRTFSEELRGRRDALRSLLGSSGDGGGHPRPVDDEITEPVDIRTPSTVRSNIP